MKIKQDPITKLWCREDGAILFPPSKYSKFKKFRWTFGSNTRGYLQVGYKGRNHKVHQIICRAFHGLPPVDKPCVDHINRVRHDNRPSNLHWVDPKENADNQADVGESIEKYGVRACDDRQAYNKAYYAAHREGQKACAKAWYAAHRCQI